MNKRFVSQVSGVEPVGVSHIVTGTLPNGQPIVRCGANTHSINWTQQVTNKTPICKSCARLELKSVHNFKRGDKVYLDDYRGRHFLVSAVWPDNVLTPDRVDICEAHDKKAFDAKRGIGMPVKYLNKVN